MFLLSKYAAWFNSSVIFSDNFQCGYSQIQKLYFGVTDGTQDEHTKHSKQFCANSTERAYKTAYLGSES